MYLEPFESNGLSNLQNLAKKKAGGGNKERSGEWWMNSDPGV